MDNAEREAVERVEQSGREAVERVEQSGREAVDLADESREKLTGQVQDDRLDDEPANQQQIRADRNQDVHIITDRVRIEARADALERDELEVVRADRLERAIALMQTIRALCVALLIVLLIVGMSSVAVWTAFNQFRADNTVIVDNHEHTQRLICHTLKVADLPPPDNGDCDHR